MDLFGKYLFRQTAASFLLVLLTLTTIVWLAIALRELDLLTSKGQGIQIFLTMTGLVLPSIMAQIAPNALLIACLYTLDRFNGDSELIVMSASGATVWRFARPLLLLTGVLTAVLVALYFYLMPLSLRTLESYVTQVRSDLIAQVLQPGRFSSPEPGLTFHIRDRAPNNDLLGLMVHDERNKEQAITYLAKRGHIVNTDEGAYLVMRNGQIHRRKDGEEGGSGEVSIGEFKEYIFDISQFEANTGAVKLEPRERYLSELLYPGEDDSYYQRAPGQFRSEIHSRFSNLLYPLVFTLITLTFLGQARTVRENRWKSVVLAFGCAVGVRIAGLAAAKMVALQSWAVALVYGIPVGAILVAALAAHVRMAPYARLGPVLDLPARLRFFNDYFGAVLGVKTTQQRGRVG
jgi:lipopolysaccharide export system permease protein